MLTAKHCTVTFEWDYAFGYKTYFAVGADAFAPDALYEVAAVEGAPGNHGGLLGNGHDVGVAYLLEPVSGIEPFAIEPITDADVGKDFIAVGYGVQGNRETYGTRRAGKMEVRATSGSFYAPIFGSFEAFKEWFLTGAVPSLEGAALGYVPPIARPIELLFPNGAARTEALVGLGSGGVAHGGGGEGGVAEGPAGAGGDSWDDEDAWLRNIYENTLLDAGYEVLMGGTEGDAQICYGDSGGPLLSTKKNGKLVVRGVASGTLNSNRVICDLASIHATFGPGVLEFVNAARRWKDPCEGLSVEGQCKGTVARRCTAPDEGPRRLVELDCSLLGQVCAQQPDGTVGCSD